MQLPSPDEIRKMRGRDVLALGEQWFEYEARMAAGSADAVSVAYGPDAVGHELRVRASANFAFATLLGSVRAKAESKDARKEDGVFASLLVSVLRAGFIPPSAAEATKNAA